MPGKNDDNGVIFELSSEYLEQVREEQKETGRKAIVKPPTKPAVKPIVKQTAKPAPKPIIIPDEEPEFYINPSKNDGKTARVPSYINKASQISKEDYDNQYLDYSDKQYIDMRSATRPRVPDKVPVQKTQSDKLKELKELKRAKQKPFYEKKQSVVSRKSSRQRTSFALFYIALLITGVGVSFYIFVQVYLTLQNSLKSSTNTPSSNTADINGSNDDNQPIVTDSSIELTCVVLGISSVQKEITLRDLTTSTDYVFAVDKDTEIKDQYGSFIIFAELQLGLIVRVETAKNHDSLLKTIVIEPKSWERLEKKGLTVKPDKKIISLGSEAFTYEDDIIVTYNNLPCPISFISPIDVVSIYGYREQVWRIVIIKSHGTLQFTANEKIKNCVVEIDTNKINTLEELAAQDNPYVVDLSEGLHKLVIKGDNINTVTKEIIITKGETLNVDLNELEVNAGIMTITANVTGYTLYINGILTEPQNGYELDFGSYAIKVVRNGYTTFETTVDFNSDELTVNATLDRIILYGSLSVTTQPISGVDIYVDGIYMGISPLTVQVEVGAHNLTVKHPDYKEVSYPISVEEGSANDPYPVQLQPLYNDDDSYFPDDYEP